LPNFTTSANTDRFSLTLPSEYLYTKYHYITDSLVMPWVWWDP